MGMSVYLFSRKAPVFSFEGGNYGPVGICHGSRSWATGWWHGFIAYSCLSLATDEAGSVIDKTIVCMTTTTKFISYRLYSSLPALFPWVVCGWRLW